MTLRRRLDHLTASHSCPVCGGTGVARPTEAALPDPMMAEATDKMLDLARAFADEHEVTARRQAERLAPHERTAAEWGRILPDELTGRDLIAALLGAIEGLGAEND